MDLFFAFTSSHTLFRTCFIQRSVFLNFEMMVMLMVGENGGSSTLMSNCHSYQIQVNKTYSDSVFPPILYRSLLTLLTMVGQYDNVNCDIELGLWTMPLSIPVNITGSDTQVKKGQSSLLCKLLILCPTETLHAIGYLTPSQINTDFIKCQTIPLTSVNTLLNFF